MRDGVIEADIGNRQRLDLADPKARPGEQGIQVGSRFA